MNIYTTITERILAQLDAGVAPWRKTWASGLPKSLVTGREYRGLNLLVLGLAEYSSRYWVTYREALRLGGHVRKGERATPVIYWKWRTPEELERRRQETGKEIPACYPFTSAVFNLDQVEGVPRPDDDVPNHPHRRLEVAEQMLAVMPDKPEIVHAHVHEPAYDPRTDRITLPHLSQFESADEYYSVVYHEAVHASGAAHRLNRFAEMEGDRWERYGFEEYAVREICCASSATRPLAGVRAVSWQHNSAAFRASEVSRAASSSASMV
jgi:antirestriction protein ArdC